MFARLVSIADRRLVRYGLASVGALAVDMGSFLALLALAVPAAAASAAGYAFGIAAHWLLSSRTVFTDSVAERGIRRTRQKALFVGSAMVGLALTTCIVGIGDLAGFDPRLAKLIAIAASFTVTWMLRNRIVFRGDGAAA
ncbi:GtrA family protein [Tsuneonella sp. YG55]|uniref:GtrA family protein n=1 Tax=Tsuneonella litorea TaxID=2976475 RepID=A0A9X2W3H9_9SPHN|nr:GtrA family protein [Tsuneonella litorea]MCT2559904.1 GtrA family protein [Tsuneonella litorea]